MSERLSELSGSVALELRTRMEESRSKIKVASTIINGMRKEPVIVDGTCAVLDRIVDALDKADELHLAAFKLINDTYGSPRADPVAESTEATTLQDLVNEKDTPPE